MNNNIEVRNLTKRYDAFALEQINLTVPKGCIMGLIGKNGSGKTTLLNAILGVTGYEEGEIYINGSGNQQNSQQHEQIGFVPDANFFNDNLTPQEIGKIMKGIYRQWDEKQYFDYLKEFALDANKKMKALSLGMKKKLLIAVALSHHAKILILDEVMNGLDPVARSEIRDMMLSFLQDEECSIFISSHIMEDLEKVCDYITLIDQGKVVLSCNKDYLLNQFGVLKCGKKEFETIDPSDYVSYRENAFGYEALVNDRIAMQKRYKHLVIDNVQLEDIMIFFARGDKS